jgi:hypothetical protein
MATSIKLRSNAYFIDNTLVDEYAEKIGAIGIAIYNVLSRFANRQTGICFPCIGTIAKKLKLGRTTVKKYLKILYKADLITILHRTSPNGDPTSNSYMLLDPSPEKVALRRRQLEALLTSQEGEFTLPGGRSPDDRPPCPTATDPWSPADPEQSSTLNKKNGTSVGALPPAEKPPAPAPTEKQQTCTHPQEDIGVVEGDIRICHHCWGLLDESLKLITAESTDTDTSEKRASAECDPPIGGEPEPEQPPAGKILAKTDTQTPGEVAHTSPQMVMDGGKPTGLRRKVVSLGKWILGAARAS